MTNKNDFEKEKDTRKSICNVHILWNVMSIISTHSRDPTQCNMLFIWAFPTLGFGCLYMKYRRILCLLKIIVLEKEVSWISLLPCSPHICQYSEDVINIGDSSSLKAVSLPFNNFMVVQLNVRISKQTLPC